MQTKAIVTHTFFLIATMALFVSFTIIALWYFIGQTPTEPARASCTAKYINYCERWLLKKNDPGDWDKIEPQNCDQFKIYKPESLDECNNII